MLPLATPFAIQAAAATLGYSISLTTAAGLVLCVAGKMLQGKDFEDAVRDCLD
jgi:hypothetical protein